MVARPAYRASQADGEAWQSASPARVLPSSITLKSGTRCDKLIWTIAEHSGWPKTQYPDDESMRVSHETIYRSLSIKAAGR